jgi:aryl-alcohol dehydrogenase-like predicted oxidoreductase
MGGPFWRADHDSISWRDDDGERFPGGWGEVDDAESIRAIHAALDAGINFFDTSDSYGAGHSERVLGRALTDRRDQVVICTKFANIIDEENKLYLGHDASPDFIRASCDASLRRLNTDYIDVYLLHWSNFEGDVDPVRETLNDLVAAGKVRWYGWSTDDPERIQKLAGSEYFSAVEHVLHVLLDAPEMLALCDEHDLASIIRSPLMMGLLTGKFSADSTFPEDDIRHGWNLAEGRGAEILSQLEAVREVLTSGGRTLAQGALAWIWARSPRAIPIPGFRTAAQVEENAGALEYGPLTAEQMEKIDNLLGRTPG